MTSLQYRRRRFTKLTLESLDDRIVPSAAGSAIHAQALEARAEHQAEIRAERAALREQRTEHQAELRAARIQARQARLAALRAARMGSNVATSAAYFSGPRATAAGARAAAFSPQSSAVVSGTATANASTNTGSSGTTSTSTSGSNSRPIVIGDNMTTTTTSSTTSAVSTDVSDIKNGPLAKAGQDLITVYTQWQKSNGNGDFTLTGNLANIVRIQGDSVGVDIGTNPSNMASAQSTLTALGMQITSTDATTGTIEGYLPISQLPTVAQDSNVLTLAPNYVPVMPAPVVDPNSGFHAS